MKGTSLGLKKFSHELLQVRRYFQK